MILGQSENEGPNEVQIVTHTLWLQEKYFSKTPVILKYALFYGVAAKCELFWKGYQDLLEEEV